MYDSTMRSKRRSRPDGRKAPHLLISLLLLSKPSDGQRVMTEKEPDGVRGTGFRLASRPRTRASSKATIRPLDAEHSSLHYETRMVENESLADYMESLLASGNGSTDFVERLRTAEQEALETKQQAKHMLWMDDALVVTLSGLAFAAISSAFWTPKVFMDTLLASSSTLAILVPWLWVSQFTTQKQLILLDAMALFQLVSMHGFDNFITRKVIPSAWKTFQSMVIVEAWKRVWAFLAKRIRHNVRPAASKKDRKNRSLHPATTSRWTPSECLRSVHTFLDSAIQKGSRSMMQKAIQKNVHATVHTAVSSVVQYTSDAATSLLLESNLGKLAFPGA